MNKLAILIKSTRINEHKTSLEFATELGITRATLSALENGGKPSATTLIKLESKFKRSVEDLLTLYYIFGA